MTEKAAHILIVDDSPNEQQYIKHLLIEGGFVHIDTAGSAEEALTHIAQHETDLILLDVIMPGMDGLSLCRHLKSMPLTADIPIILLTGLNDRQARIAAYNAGGSDYVVKPPHKAELLTRVRLLATNGRKRRELKTITNARERELTAAQTLQNSLLPTRAELTKLSADHKLGLHIFSRSCSALTGDYWCVQPLTDSTLLIALLDMTGHGLGAAMNTLLLHRLIAQVKQSCHTPQEMLHLINKHLSEKLMPGQTATGLVLIYDRTDKTLSYAGTAHPPLCYIATNQPPELITCAGLPLGMAMPKSYTYAAGTFQLGAGDTLYAYSDGLIDTPLPQYPNSIGLKGVQAYFTKTAAQTWAVRRKALNAPPHVVDDLTVIELKGL